MVMFVSKDVALARKQECEVCPARATIFCSECGCLVAAKVRLSQASCPLGRWLAADAELEMPWDVEEILREHAKGVTE